jgi:hypothetical protein
LVNAADGLAEPVAVTALDNGIGQRAWEEIDFELAGSAGGINDGWDWLEGRHCHPEDLTPCPRQEIGVLPVVQYAHGMDGCVVGIGVSRAPLFPPSPASTSIPIGAVARSGGFATTAAPGGTKCSSTPG